VWKAIANFCSTRILADKVQADILVKSVSIKKASIVSKIGKPELGKVVVLGVEWLRRNSYAITADAATLEFCSDCELMDREHLAAAAPNFVVVLGGDGTLLSPGGSVSR